MKYLAFVLAIPALIMLISGCQQEHKTITVKLKIVAEYDPDHPTKLHNADKIPWREVLTKQESALIAAGWKRLYKVPGKYTPDRAEYQLWLEPSGQRCFKTLSDSNGIVRLIEGPYTPPI